eukprot:gene5083-325_t
MTTEPPDLDNLASFDSQAHDLDNLTHHFDPGSNFWTKHVLGGDPIFINELFSAIDEEASICVAKAKSEMRRVRAETTASLTIQRIARMWFAVKELRRRKKEYSDRLEAFRTAINKALEDYNVVFESSPMTLSGLAKLPEESVTKFLVEDIQASRWLIQETRALLQIICPPNLSSSVRSRRQHRGSRAKSYVRHSIESSAEEIQVSVREDYWTATLRKLAEEEDGRSSPGVIPFRPTKSSHERVLSSKECVQEIAWMEKLDELTSSEYSVVYEEHDRARKKKKGVIVIQCIFRRFLAK